MLAGGCTILFHVVGAGAAESGGWMLWVLKYLAYMVSTNVLLAVFNMIPIPPLDGGNVLMGVVPERMAHAIDWLRPYGFVILYVLMWKGTLGQIVFPVRDAVERWLL